MEVLERQMTHRRNKNVREIENSTFACINRSYWTGEIGRMLLIAVNIEPTELVIKEETEKRTHNEVDGSGLKLDARVKQQATRKGLAVELLKRQSYKKKKWWLVNKLIPQYFLRRIQGALWMVNLKRGMGELLIWNLKHFQERANLNIIRRH